MNSTQENLRENSSAKLNHKKDLVAPWNLGIRDTKKYY